MRMTSNSAYMSFTAQSGNSYTSDVSGVIASVAEGDVVDMINMGCSPAEINAAGEKGTGATLPIVGKAGVVGTGTTAGTAGGSVSLTAGVGGAKTDVGHAAGGAGADADLVASAGGATASNGTDAGGAGGDSHQTAGDGGAASAGTGAGGAAGNIVRKAGTGGTSAGGTAGLDGVIYDRSPVARKMTRSTITTGATLTAAQILGGILFQDASGGAVTMATPTGTVLEAALRGVATGDALDLHVASNHATNTSTLSGATDITLVGSGAVTQLGGHFKLIRTGTHTYDLVRVG